MKTGGTLNFLKRAGAIFMLIAVFASSCNKYADDFKQLNTKLDALATQVAGVTQLTTDMTALKSQVTALQTSVAGLPNVASITALQTALTAISGKVDALTTTLNAVAASGTATKAVVDGLKTDLAALATKVAADNAAAIAKLVAMDGKLDANQAAALKAINDQAAALSAKIAAETVAITGKVDAAAAASAAAAAANLAQMATNQAALVASLNGISAAQAANLAALTAEITALKTNMTEQLTAMTAANTANLNTLLASNAALASAMTAQFDAMTAADLANLATLEGKLSATQAALATLINDIQATNAGSFASLLAAQAAQTAQDAATALETANALAQLIASQNAQIAAADANNAASAASIAALKAMLDAQAIQLKIILDNTSMYNGDVVITTDAEVDFFLAKLAQLGIINGQGATALTVNTSGISASRIADVNIICSKIKAVIGGGNATISFKTGNGLDLSALAYVKGNLAVTGLSGATGVDVKLGALATVSGNVTYSYDGPYESTSLATVGGNLVLTNVPTSSSPVRVGTTAINFPIAAVAGVLSDATTPGNPTFASVTGAIVVGGQMTGITANKATSVKLLNAWQAAGLVVNAALATSVDLGTLVNINYNNVTGVTTAGGAIVVNSAAGSTVNLDKFLGRNGTSTAVQEDIQLEGPTAASIPLWLTGIFRSATVKDLTLAKNDMLAAADAIFVPGSVIENLTLGNLKGFANLFKYPTLKTVNITGNNPALGTGASVSAWATNTVLTTLNVSGAVYNVYVWNTPKLTTFTTAAGSTINDVEIDGATLLAGVSFGHKHLSTSIGSNIRIYNNPELLSLTTSTDKPQWLEVGNNPKLATADFSSYQNFLFFTPMTIKIYGNKIGADYKNAVAATPTDGYIQSKLTCASLATLKGLFAAWDADQALGLAKTSTATWSIDVRLGNYVTIDGGSTKATLAARLGADFAHKVSDTGLNYSVPGTGLATYRELRDILQ